jgi:hypothetical protein
MYVDLYGDCCQLQQQQTGSGEEKRALRVAAGGNEENSSDCKVQAVGTEQGLARKIQVK